MSLTLRRLVAPALALLAGALGPLSARAERLVVAVLYFDNNTGSREYDVLHKGLADMLVTDLSQVDALQVVEREKLEALLGELRLQRTRYFDAKTAQRLGQGIGARFAVTGAFAALDPRMRIDVRLIEVATAKVLMADKVVGDKSRFFELQEALVRKFIAGLDVRAPGGGSKSKVSELGTLLKYSRGVDAADRGDLETASRQLAEVVRTEPEFVLGKEKYAEIVRKLREAAKRRKSALGSTEELLWKSVDAWVAKDPAKLDARELARFFGYRVARGNLLLLKIQRLVGAPEFPLYFSPTPERHRAEVLSLMRQYFDNTQAFIAEMRAARERAAPKLRPGWKPELALSPEDLQRARDLGYDELHVWSFATPQAVSQALAQFTAVGRSPFWTKVEVVVRPSLATADPAYGAKALALLGAARRELVEHEEGGELSRALGDLAAVHGELLVELGRKEEAIAQWQGYLDEFPKGEKFQELEKKIEDLLGLSAEAEAFEKLLERCDPELSSGLHGAVARTASAEGLGGVRRLIGRLESACKGELASLGHLATLAHFASVEAIKRGDCGFYRELVEKLERGPLPGVAAPLKELAWACR